MAKIFVLVPDPQFFLQHGLLDSSCTWVLNSETQSLAFILADKGYDVWLGNTRGNRYSRASTRWTPDQPEFWAWTWDELAKFDVPTSIDYVLSVTKNSKLSWIGHSRGTQMMFAALSINPTIADKLDIFIALAPVAFLKNLRSELLQILATFDTGDLLDWIGIHEFLPAGTTLDEILPELCSFYPQACDDIGHILFGCCDPANTNETRLPVLWNHMPSGTSSQEIAHYAQAVNLGGPQMYDFGRAGNQLHYGQPTPPRYNLLEIPASLPIALFTGNNDILADSKDVLQLTKLIRPSIVHVNNQPAYTHMDFVWGILANTQIYPDILSLLKKYAK